VLHKFHSHFEELSPDERHGYLRTTRAVLMCPVPQVRAPVLGANLGGEILSQSPASPLFTISRRPFRFDLHDPNLPQRIMPIAAPLPLPQGSNQAALYRIPVQVAQLNRELALVSHVAVIVSLLPELPDWPGNRRLIAPYTEPGLILSSIAIPS